MIAIIRHLYGVFESCILYYTSAANAYLGSVFQVSGPDQDGYLRLYGWQ